MDWQNNFTVVPIRITDYKVNNRQHVNMLIIQNIYLPKQNYDNLELVETDNIEIRYHYCWIKNLSKFNFFTTK